MGSAHNRRVKSILKKGTLTGSEVAKIILSQLYELEKISEPELYDLESIKNFKEAAVLTSEEIDALKNTNLRGSDVTDKTEEFNSWMGAFNSFLSIIYSAHILYLKIEHLLSICQIFLERYLTEAFLKMHLAYSIPELLTEKQYEDIKAKQKQTFLKEPNCLEWILFNRAGALAEKNHGYWAMEALLGGSQGEQSEAVQFYRQACSDIRSLIKSGKLSVTYEKKVLSLLDSITTKKPDKDILAYIDSSISAEPERQPEKPEPLLEKSTATGEALVNAGLPEWREHIDEYKHNFGGSPPYDVAILQDPSPDQVDDNGYYKKRRSLADHTLFGNPDTYLWKSLKQTPRSAFTAILNQVRHKIELFLFKRSLAEVLTEETGIKFSEQTDKWWGNIKSALSNYATTLDRTIRVSDRAKDSLGGILDISVDLHELQIKPELEERFRKLLSEEKQLMKWSLGCLTDFNEEKINDFESGEA